MYEFTPPLTLRSPRRDDGRIDLTQYLFAVLVLTAILKKYCGFR